MLANDQLRLLVHLHHQQCHHPVRLIAAPAVQDSPELLPVHGVIGFLEVDQGREVPPLFALPRMDLGE